MSSRGINSWNYNCQWSIFQNISGYCWIILSVSNGGMNRQLTRFSNVLKVLYIINDIPTPTRRKPSHSANKIPVKAPQCDIHLRWHDPTNTCSCKVWQCSLPPAPPSPRPLSLGPWRLGSKLKQKKSILGSFLNWPVPLWYHEMMTL